MGDRAKSRLEAPRRRDDHAPLTHQAVGDWMTSDPQSISPDATVEEAFQRMIDGHFRYLLVVDEGRPVGMLSMRDISRLQLKGK